MIHERTIERVLDAALSTGGDFAEIFVEDRFSNRYELQTSTIETAVSGRDFGIGIRIFSGVRSIYTYTTSFEEKVLIESAQRAAYALCRGESILQSRPMIRETFPKQMIEKWPNDVEAVAKTDILRQMDDYARAYNPRIAQVRVRYFDETQHVLIANSDGRHVEDTRVHSRINIVPTAEENGVIQTGHYGPGGHAGFEWVEQLNHRYYAEEASRIAVTMLHADECPSGKFPVIIDNEFGGVIFHEACGHGLEATAVAKGNSVFADRVGEKVASDLVTYIDDGTIPNAWGSLNVDDEGEPTRKNVLIEKGRLKGFLVDRLNGRRMGAAPTGSSRRQSYQFAPTSRMTNTYIENGETDPADIIASTEYGIYAKYMGGGSVNPATGDYNFAVMEGYIVKDGKIGRPIKGATLIGNGAETLYNVDRVGNNLAHGAGKIGRAHV